MENVTSGMVFVMTYSDFPIIYEHK